MKVYYAHPMSWYGTDRETADIACIANNTPMGTEIVNPNSAEFAEEITRTPMKYQDVMLPFRKAVQDCDAIAYRTFDDGSIGAGVGNELLTAALHGKQIFRLRDRSTDHKVLLMEETHGLGASFGPRLLTITETRDYLKRGVM